jgi:hypothetical protein
MNQSDSEMLSMTESSQSLEHEDDIYSKIWSDGVKVI